DRHRRHVAGRCHRIAFLTRQTLEFLARRIEPKIAEDTVERLVLEHEDDDVMDALHRLLLHDRRGLGREVGKNLQRLCRLGHSVRDLLNFLARVLHLLDDLAELAARRLELVDLVAQLPEDERVLGLVQLRLEALEKSPILADDCPITEKPLYRLLRLTNLREHCQPFRIGHRPRLWWFSLVSHSRAFLTSPCTRFAALISWARVWMCAMRAFLSVFSFVTACTSSLCALRY